MTPGPFDTRGPTMLAVILGVGSLLLPPGGHPAPPVVPTRAALTDIQRTRDAALHLHAEALRLQERLAGHANLIKSHAHHVPADAQETGRTVKRPGGAESR